MKYITIAAAAPFHLAHATLPSNSDPAEVVRLVDEGPGTARSTLDPFSPPTLYGLADGKETISGTIFSFETVKQPDPLTEPARNVPILFYALAKSTSDFSLNLVQPSREGKDIKSDGTSAPVMETWPTSIPDKAYSVLGQLGSPVNADSRSKLGRHQAIIDKFTNGTEIPNGRYQVSLKVLKRGANSKDANSFESWVSIPFEVKRQ